MVRRLSSSPGNVLAAFDRYGIQTKGPQAGQRVPLKPFQSEWVRNIYARDDQGRRRYNTIFQVGPKKIGKSFFWGHIALLETTVFGQHGGDVYGMASSFKQGSELFEPASQVAQHSELAEGLGLQVRPSTLEIKFPALENRFAVMSLGSSGAGEELHGKAPRVLLIDELHAFRNRAAYENIREGMMIWETLDPIDSHFTVFISNWGEAGGSPAFWQELEYARKVQADPSFDPTWFVDIAEPPAGMQPDELLRAGPKVWAGFHQGLQSGLATERFLLSKASEALHKPSMRPKVVRLHFCLPMEADTAAINLAKWDACADPALSWENPPDAELPCFAGLDMAANSDLCALTLLWPERLDEFDDHGEYLYRVHWLSKAWLPEGRLMDLEAVTKKPLRDWAQAGILSTTPGDTIDDRYVRAAVMEAYERFQLRRIGFDPKFCSRLARDFSDERLPIVSLRQTESTFTEPLRSIEDLYLRSNIRHTGDALLRWNAESLMVCESLDGGLRPAKLDRQTSSRRIDVMLGGIMANWCRLHDDSPTEEGGFWA